jgi:hypothetical protein
VANYKAVLIGAALGLLAGMAGAVYLAEHKKAAPVPAKLFSTAVAPSTLDANKISAQLSLLSGQIEAVRQILLLRASGGPAVPAAIAPVPQALLATPAAPVAETPAPVKHKAAPKKAASSGWFGGF